MEKGKIARRRRTTRKSRSGFLLRLALQLEREAVEQVDNLPTTPPSRTRHSSAIPALPTPSPLPRPLPRPSPPSLLHSHHPPPLPPPPLLRHSVVGGNLSTLSEPRSILPRRMGVREGERRSGQAGWGSALGDRRGIVVSKRAFVERREDGEGKALLSFREDAIVTSESGISNLGSSSFASPQTFLTNLESQNMSPRPPWTHLDGALSASDRRSTYRRLWIKGCDAESMGYRERNSVAFVGGS